MPGRVSTKEEQGEEEEEEEGVGKRSRGGGGPGAGFGGGPVRAAGEAALCVYTRRRNRQFEFVRCNTRSQSISAQDGRRQGRKGFWKGEAEGSLEERQGWTPVPCWQVGIIFLEEGGSFGRERDATASGGVESSL